MTNNLKILLLTYISQFSNLTYILQFLCYFLLPAEVNMISKTQMSKYRKSNERCSSPDSNTHKNAQPSLKTTKNNFLILFH